MFLNTDINPESGFKLLSSKKNEEEQGWAKHLHYLWQVWQVVGGQILCALEQNTPVESKETEWDRKVEVMYREEG